MKGPLSYARLSVLWLWAWWVGCTKFVYVKYDFIENMALVF